jgi:hypothetical protein
MAGAVFVPGTIAVVTADGSARQVADGIAFPNGMAVTPDNSTLIVAESYGKKLTAFDIGANGGLSNRRVWADLGDGVPDGICLDSENAVWYAGVPNKRCVRVREVGETLQTINLSRLLRLHARGHRQENAASGGDRVAWRRRDDRRAADGSGADRQGARARRGLAIGSFRPGPLLGISGIHSWQPICLRGQKLTRWRQMHLSIIVCNLELQLSELDKLRYQVRQAELSARKSRRTDNGIRERLDASQGPRCSVRTEPTRGQPSSGQM